MRLYKRLLDLPDTKLKRIITFLLFPSVPRSPLDESPIMAVRLDVNLFDANEGKAKKTNCVPLKDFEISKKTLGDIRTALIDNGGLDASKYVCGCGR